MITKTQVPSFLFFELQDINTTSKLVFDVTKPNILTYSSMNGNFTILKDKVKWLAPLATEQDVKNLVSLLKEGIMSTVKIGRPGYVVATNYPVTFIRPIGK
jgi:predicted DNA-binding transcriptional regulator